MSRKGSFSEWNYPAHFTNHGSNRRLFRLASHLEVVDAIFVERSPRDCLRVQVRQTRRYSTVFCQNKYNPQNIYKQEIPPLTFLHWFPTSHQDVKIAWTTSLSRCDILSSQSSFFFRITGSIIHQNYGHIQGSSASHDWYVLTSLIVSHSLNVVDRMRDTRPH